MIRSSRVVLAMLTGVLLGAACVPTDGGGSTVSTTVVSTTSTTTVPSTSSTTTTTSSTTSTLAGDAAQCLADRRAIVDGWSDFIVARDYLGVPHPVLSDYLTVTSVYFLLPGSELGVLRTSTPVAGALCPDIPAGELGNLLGCLLQRRNLIAEYPAWLAALAANPSARYQDYLDEYPMAWTLPGSQVDGIHRRPGTDAIVSFVKCPDIAPAELQ